MKPTRDAPSEFVPLTPESREIYAKFWAQIGCATTTVPPMDFLELKEGALRWSEKLDLPAGILVKFRQRLARAQHDQAVFDLMEQFARLGSARVAALSLPTGGGAPISKKTAKTLTCDWRNKLLLDDVRRVAKKLGKKTVTKDEYERLGRSTAPILIKRFHGWNNALLSARLGTSKLHNISVQELFENLDRIWKALGHPPSRTEMVSSRSKYSASAYRRRFGGWVRAKKLFAAWKRTGKLPKEANDLKKTTNSPGPLLAYLVMKRDRFMCVICGKSPSTHPGTILELDHIKPRSRGGRTVYENLRTLCKTCNVGKGDL